VHPTFLYESLWNLGVLLILLWITFRVKKRFDGMVFLYYLLLYGIGRFWIERLRTDQLLLPHTGIPVSQLLSGILVVLSAVLLITQKIKERNE
jgi:phosphatidylglycerol:prolipoprotein diacylglycerol transferase